MKQAATPAALPAARLICLVHDNALVARDIAAQLEHFGYRVVIVSELAQLQASIIRSKPAAVVMDLAFPSGIMAGAAEIARIRKACPQHFAAIFISTRSNFEARLATVRAGADGYFSKPLDMVALIERLDTLTAEDHSQPYRVLIIGGERAGAEYYDAILRQAGMDVEVLPKLNGMLQVLADYRPELVLMDVHLPECPDTDLARLIRQDTLYLDVPIVFLAAEADIAKQLAMIESGGDDFLIKPITPAHLVSAISNRARRYRALRGLIMRDGLTGLLNHSALKEHLGREVARAERDRAPLAVAMVDIDFFKRVNDSYGHPVGDQVIRALSRMLLQRLRRGDIVGRYGGEEFAVIMPGTTAAAAAAVLDQIRASFANIRHYAEHQEFTVTLSAGIAGLTAEDDAETLLASADAALYQAKHHGRNRVAQAAAE